MERPHRTIELIYCSNIPAAPAYIVYIFQLIRYSRDCGSYQDFLDRGLLLTRKLLNQGFLLVKLKSPLRKFYGRHNDLAGNELRCFGSVSSPCSTNGTHRANLVTNLVISHEWGKDREVFTTSGTYPWSFVTQIFHSNAKSRNNRISIER
jgi:hypothetical protein